MQGTLTGMRSGGQTYYYLTDIQGSVLGLTDASGNLVDSYTYDPAGKSRTVSQTAPQPYRYTSAWLDASGLYKMGARYYDPTIERFTQPDPTGQENNAYSG